jgi:hypothetical protein
MSAVSSCRSRSSFTCSLHEGGTAHLLISRPCFRFATEPASLAQAPWQVQSPETFERQRFAAMMQHASRMVSPLLVSAWFTLKSHAITKEGANRRPVHCPIMLLFMLRR